MAAPRRKISKQERKGRDALMRVVNWVHILVIKRLFDEGRSNSEVALLYDSLQREAGRIAIAHAMPDWHYVDETQVAELVYQSLTKEVR
jgi:hypothetical protein